MTKELEALDRLCNMALGECQRDFALAKTDYWIVKDGLGARFNKICYPDLKTEIEIWKSASGPWYARIWTDAAADPSVYYQAPGKSAQDAIELAVKYFEADMD